MSSFIFLHKDKPRITELQTAVSKNKSALQTTMQIIKCKYV